MWNPAALLQNCLSWVANGNRCQPLGKQPMNLSILGTVVELFIKLRQGKAFGDNNMLPVGQNQPGQRPHAPPSQHFVCLTVDEAGCKRHLVFFEPSIDCLLVICGDVNKYHADILTSDERLVPAEVLDTLPRWPLPYIPETQQDRCISELTVSVTSPVGFSQLIDPDFPGPVEPATASPGRHGSEPGRGSLQPARQTHPQPGRHLEDKRMSAILLPGRSP
jgi:hypothetical protein